MELLKKFLSYHVGKPILNFVLMLIFIVSNIVFIYSYAVVNWLTIIANDAAMKNYDNFIDIAFGELELIILYIVIFLIIKIISFYIIYHLAKFIDNSSRLYKFLFSFLNRYRYRLKVVLFVICVDIIILFVLHMCNVESISSSLFTQCGGVTISYIAFSILAPKKEIEYY